MCQGRAAVNGGMRTSSGFLGGENSVGCGVVDMSSIGEGG